MNTIDKSVLLSFNKEKCIIAEKSRKCTNNHILKQRQRTVGIYRKNKMHSSDCNEKN